MAQYTTQSGLAASTASRSLVAVVPVAMAKPASSPASLPTLASDDTQTPVRSKPCVVDELPQCEAAAVPGADERRHGSPCCFSSTDVIGVCVPSPKIGTGSNSSIYVM